MTGKYKQIYDSINNKENFWKDLANNIFGSKTTKILNSSNPPFIDGMKMV